MRFGYTSLNIDLDLWLVSEAVSRPAENAAFTLEPESSLGNNNIEVLFTPRYLHLRTVVIQTKKVLRSCWLT